MVPHFDQIYYVWLKLFNDRLTHSQSSIYLDIDLYTHIIFTYYNDLCFPLSARKIFLDSLMYSRSETRAQQHSRQTLIRKEPAHIFIFDLTRWEKEISPANIKPRVDSGLTWSGLITITTSCSCWKSSSMQNRDFWDLTAWPARGISTITLRNKSYFSF